MKVLIAQSDEEFTDMMKEWFVEYGFKVDVAYDGEECLEKVLKNDYDAIVINLLLSKVDAIEVIKKFKKSDRRKGRIIVTSNIKTEIAICEVIKAGGDGYEIMTEVTPYQLAQNIKGYISGELTTEESFRKALVVARTNDKKCKEKKNRKFKYKHGKLDSIRDVELGDIPLIHKDDSSEEVRRKEKIVQDKIKNI
ncbi:response regulator [Candidatus Dojkabacteria bacterium]|nr:response regulator [Candidatus Dojkabacteria bacterium]